MPYMNICASDAAYVSKANPTQNYNHSSLLTAGNNSQYNSSVILLKFEKPLFLENIKIKHAQLLLYIDKGTNVYSNEYFSTYNVYPNFTDFDERTVHWNNRPANPQKPFTEMKIHKHDLNSYVRYQVTGLANDWFTNEKPNYGLTISESGDNKNDFLSIHSNTNSSPPMLHLECEENKENKVCKEYKDYREYEEFEEYNEHIQKHNNAEQHITNNFVEETFCLCATQLYQYSPKINISQSRTVSFLINNFGSISVEASLQISPDGIHFLDDPQTITIQPQETAALTPYMFAKFIRVKVKSNEHCANSAITIWYQAQLLSYTME